MPFGGPVHGHAGGRDLIVEHARRDLAESVSDGGSTPPASTNKSFISVQESPFSEELRGLFCFLRFAVVRRSSLTAAKTEGKITTNN